MITWCPWYINWRTMQMNMFNETPRIFVTYQPSFFWQEHCMNSHIFFTHWKPTSKFDIFCCFECGFLLVNKSLNCWVYIRNATCTHWPLSCYITVGDIISQLSNAVNTYQASYKRYVRVRINPGNAARFRGMSLAILKNVVQSMITFGLAYYGLIYIHFIYILYRSGLLSWH